MSKNKEVFVVMANYVYGGGTNFVSLLANVPSHRARIMRLTGEKDTIIVGRKAWDLLGEKLKKKSNPKIIITNNKKFRADHPKLVLASSVKEAIELAKTEHVWVIGGIRTINSSLEYANTIYHVFVFNDNSLSNGPIVRPPYHSRKFWEIVKTEPTQEKGNLLQHDLYYSVCITFHRR